MEIEHGIVRQAVEAQELERAQGSWVRSNARHQQQGIRDYFKGKFDTNKTYFTTKPARPRDPLITQVSEQRVRSSLGIRIKTAEENKRVLSNSLARPSTTQAAPSKKRMSKVRPRQSQE